MHFSIAQSKPTTVNGSMGHAAKTAVKLYTVNHGRLEEIAASWTDTAGRFGFLFYPATEGFYIIGPGNENIAMDKHTFYFKPGDQLNVSIGDGNYALTDKNSAENMALAAWHQQAANIEQTAVYLLRGKSETFNEFFPKLESFVGGLPAWQPVKTGNKKFDEAFTRRRKVDVLSWAISFIFSPNTAHPTAADYTAYYQAIKAADYTRDGYLLTYPMGNRLLSYLPMVEDMVAGRKLNMDLDARMGHVLNDTLRGEVVLQNAGSLKTYLGYQDLDKNYGKYILTADQQRRLGDIKAKLAKEASKPGAPAINFTYPDDKGQTVSLTDFKGKVVLVDVWATWCGPCKGEIPHLKQMEEEMRGKDVVFMSVSVDEQKDHQKWKDFIVKESLKGVQLFAAGWSDIARNYDIKGIPRFMVFDKKGNIVSIDAPRPSGNELKLLLEAELNK
jgi:thiol-disulfide isomerase/thioredoxin